jgi:CrcB protein
MTGGEKRVAETSAERLPSDSDIDLHGRAQRFELLRAPGGVLAAISVGGAFGAVSRWVLGVAFPVSTSGFPWATFFINVSGCALIGVLMVLVAEVFTRQRLIRPFLGIGVLGGYTTFSTYIVDINRLITEGAGVTGLLYLAVTLIAALLATSAAITTTRLAVGASRSETETKR